MFETATLLTAAALFVIEIGLNLRA
jgi:hypothetical protein